MSELLCCRALFMVFLLLAACHLSLSIKWGKLMTSVDISTRFVEGVAVLYPGAYLNQLRGEAIERRCQELLAEGERHIVINFAETELINSIGISILLGVIEAVNEAQGTLVMSNL